MESHKDTLPFQIVNFLPSNSTAPRADCTFLVSARPPQSRFPLSSPQLPGCLDPWSHEPPLRAAFS